MKNKLLLSSIILALLSIPSLAAMPRTFNYQGKLLNSTTKVPVTSSMLATFLIYDNATTGSPLWYEEQPITPDANGVISVVLGNITPINIDFSKQLWLAVEAPTGVSNALWPRRQLTAAPYAIYAVTAEAAKIAITAEALSTPAKGTVMQITSERVCLGENTSGGITFNNSTWTQIMSKSVTVGSSNIIIDYSGVIWGVTPGSNANIRLLFDGTEIRSTEVGIYSHAGNPSFNAHVNNVSPGTYSIAVQGKDWANNCRAVNFHDLRIIEVKN